MTMGDRIKHAAEEAGGKLQETTGQVTGNQDLQAEGHAHRASADFKQPGDKAKDALGRTVEH